jgi:hypothetical protein
MKKFEDRPMSPNTWDDRTMLSVYQNGSRSVMIAFLSVISKFKDRLISSGSIIFQSDFYPPFSAITDLSFIIYHLSLSFIIVLI